MTGAILAVASGGALGAVARYLISIALAGGDGFPWATLAANLLGCLAIGLAWASWAQLGWFQQWGRAFLVVGVLGGFTTFSAFSLETLLLVAADRFAAAAIYSGLSLAGCLGMTWLGHRLAGG